MKRVLIALVLTVSLLATGYLGQAADATTAKSAEQGKASKRAKQMPFHGKIGAVDKVAKTITLQGKEKSRAFRMTSETRINKDGKPAVFEDVQVGESVGGLARPNEAGEWELVTLNLGVKASKAEKKAARKTE